MRLDLSASVVSDPASLGSVLVLTLTEHAIGAQTRALGIAAPPETAWQVVGNAVRLVRGAETLGAMRLIDLLTLDGRLIEQAGRWYFARSEKDARRQHADHVARALLDESSPAERMIAQAEAMQTYFRVARQEAFKAMCDRFEKGLWADPTKPLIYE